jgi:hypothetical protein
MNGVNQGPPAEMARPLPGAILIHPALLVVADLLRKTVIVGDVVSSI